VRELFDFLEYETIAPNCVEGFMTTKKEILESEYFEKFTLKEVKTLAKRRKVEPWAAETFALVVRLEKIAAKYRNWCIKQYNAEHLQKRTTVRVNLLKLASQMYFYAPIYDAADYGQRVDYRDDDDD
jgi:hypothetical protein